MQRNAVFEREKVKIEVMDAETVKLLTENNLQEYIGIFASKYFVKIIQFFFFNETRRRWPEVNF